MCNMNYSFIIDHLSAGLCTAKQRAGSDASTRSIQPFSWCKVNAPQGTYTVAREIDGTAALYLLCTSFRTSKHFFVIFK